MTILNFEKVKIRDSTLVGLLEIQNLSNDKNFRNKLIKRIWKPINNNILIITSNQMFIDIFDLHIKRTK